jgi:hypothetical protein
MGGRENNPIIVVGILPPQLGLDQGSHEKTNK